MAEVPKGLKCLCFGMCPKCLAIVAWVLEILGLASLVLGIVSGFRNNAVGLYSTEWFLIAIALFILGLWVWLVAYAAARE
ncbi:MAG: hypothetical protein GH159_05115 [Dehalococcoidia bacterium]|nr:hypothetical protein [Dehalococcoidia bacterium]